MFSKSLNECPACKNQSLRMMSANEYYCNSCGKDFVDKLAWYRIGAIGFITYILTLFIRFDIYPKYL